jgi:hypothetical protein
MYYSLSRMVYKLWHSSRGNCLFKRAKRGTAEVLTTLILFSVMFTLVITASSVANETVNAQVEYAEFEQAKNVLLSLDKLVKRVMYKPDSSGYVKTSFCTVLPYLVQPQGNITVEVYDGTLLHNLTRSIPATQIKIKGGSRTSVGLDTDLVGQGKMILTKTSDSIGHVRAYQSQGAWVSLDYLRVTCIDTGTTQYYNSTTSAYETNNCVEVTLVNLAFKEIQFQQDSHLIVINEGMDPSRTKLISPSGSFYVRVRSGLDGTSETLTLSSPYKTLVTLVVINLGLSVSGGA